MNLAGGAINFLWGALQGVIPFLQNIGAAVFPIITGAVNAASGAVQALGGAFQTAWSIIQPIVGWIVEKVTWMGQQVQNALGGLSGIASGIGGALSGIGSFLGFDKHATGGTFTQPHLAVIGDAPETIVPHGNTPHNRRLLAEAARGVGATTPSTDSQGGSVNIVFNATITGGNAQEVRQGVLQAESDLESRLDAYFSKRKRVAF